MAEWHKVASLDDFPAGTAPTDRRRPGGGDTFNVDGSFMPWMESVRTRGGRWEKDRSQAAS